MLDLSQLDRNCGINQILCWNWQDRTEINPINVFREQYTLGRIIAAFATCLSANLLALVVWPIEARTLAPAVFTALLFILAIAVRKFVGKKVVAAESFAEALEKLRKIFSVDYVTLARLGEKELKAKADEHLSSLAGVIKVDEKESASLAELTRSKFRDAHQLFRDFLLVEKQWDRFFKQESKDEQAERTASLDIIRGDEGNPVMDFVQS